MSVDYKFCIYCQARSGKDESGCLPDVCWSCNKPLRDPLTLEQASVKIEELEKRIKFLEANIQRRMK